MTLTSCLYVNDVHWEGKKGKGGQNSRNTSSQSHDGVTRRKFDLLSKRSNPRHELCRCVCMRDRVGGKWTIARNVMGWPTRHYLTWNMKLPSQPVSTKPNGKKKPHYGGFTLHWLKPQVQNFCLRLLAVRHRLRHTPVYCRLLHHNSCSGKPIFAGWRQTHLYLCAKHQV